MKTVLQYLEEQKQMAWHNRLCYSKTYAMETPRDGYEKEFDNSVRDCEIVDQLINLVTRAVDPVSVPRYKTENENREPEQQNDYVDDLDKTPYYPGKPEVSPYTANKFTGRSH